MEVIHSEYESEKMFGRINDDGDVRVMFADEGDDVCTMDVDNLYPVDSNLSVHHSHPEGIVISLTDAERIGLEIEY